MTRLDWLQTLLLRHPAGLGTADLAARLGDRRSGNPATRAQVNDLAFRLRRDRGLVVVCVGKWPNARYRLAS